MPKKRFSDEQIAFALSQAEAGTTAGGIWQYQSPPKQHLTVQ